MDAIWSIGLFTVDRWFYQGDIWMSFCCVIVNDIWPTRLLCVIGLTSNLIHLSHFTGWKGLMIIDSCTLSKLVNTTGYVVVRQLIHSWTAWRKSTHLIEENVTKETMRIIYSYNIRNCCSAKIIVDALCFNKTSWVVVLIDNTRLARLTGRGSQPHQVGLAYSCLDGINDTNENVLHVQDYSKYG